jgi:hypothetical protein
MQMYAWYLEFALRPNINALRPIDIMIETHPHVNGVIGEFYRWWENRPQVDSERDFLESGLLEVFPRAVFVALQSLS